MKTFTTEISFILDRSGSMQSHLEPAIAGFNKFLHDQKKTSTNARFTLVLFDDQYEVPCASIPISEVVELDTTTFVPRGSTALLDAMGQTLDNLHARLEKMSTDQRPKQIIVAILTDGMENASHKFTHRQISDKIAHLRDNHDWQFFFLGANQDAIATASELNISAQNTAHFHDSADGHSAAYAAISRKTAAIRKLAESAPLTREEQADLRANLSDIVNEEFKPKPPKKK